MCRSRCSVCFAESIIAILTAAFATSSLAQNGLPAQIEAPPESRYFGSRVASGGDADNDGADDIFVIDDGAEESGIVLGRWHMYSGRDRTLMWSGVGTELGPARWSFSGAFVGDLDGDGCDEVMLGRPTLSDYRGGVDVFSGRTGDRLFSYRGETPSDRLGRGVSGVGDQNGDEHPDFAFIAAWGANGYVSIRSGRDGDEIRRLHVDWAHRLRPAGDVDRDGHDDIAIGTRDDRGGSGGFLLLSGLDGSIIHELQAPDPGDRDFGSQITAGVDVTGDDSPDFIVSGNVSSLPPHRAYLLSGATGEVVTTYLYQDSQQPANLFGIHLALADVTGDGNAEAIIGGARIVLVYDPLSARIINHRFIVEIRDQFSGSEIAMGDVNGDGLGDFVFGQIEQFPGGGNVAIESGGRLLMHLDRPSESPRYLVVAGHPARFEVFGGEVGRTIHLLATRAGIGCTFVPRLGICIDLATPILRVGEAVTEPDGFARFVVAVPLRAPESTAWIQTLDVNHPQRGPITSNVMEVEIVRR